MIESRNYNWDSPSNSEPVSLDNPSYDEEEMDLSKLPALLEMEQPEVYDLDSYLDDFDKEILHGSDETDADS